MSVQSHMMREVLKLAERGRGHVKTNPLVGAVVVRDGEVVARGYHRRYGGPHAEGEALKKAGSKAKGADLYVNLEPCSHWGKTPPCADAIIRAGVRRVFVGTADPNPFVRGRGMKRLKVYGITVKNGVLGAQAKRLNRAFFRRIARRRSHHVHTIIKTVMTVDGKINVANAKKQTVLSPPQDLKRRDTERAAVDAILIGGHTLELDDPRLILQSKRLRHARVREWKSADPIKIAIVTNANVISPTSRFLRTGECEKLIFTTKHSPARTLKLLEPYAHIFQFGRKRVDMEEVFRVLPWFGIRKLIVEGGGTINAELLRLGLVDELFVKIAPRIFGGNTASTLVDGDGFDTKTAPHLKLKNIENVTKDFIVLQYKVRKKD